MFIIQFCEALRHCDAACQRTPEGLFNEDIFKYSDRQTTNERFQEAVKQAGLTAVAIAARLSHGAAVFDRKMGLLTPETPPFCEIRLSCIGVY